MKVSERIAQIKADILAKRNKLTELATKDEPDEADEAAIDQLRTEVDKLVVDLRRYEDVEKSLALGAQPAGQEGHKGKGAPSLALGGHMNRKGGVEVLVRNALAIFESHVTHVPVEQIIEQRWGTGNVAETVLETSRLLSIGGRALFRAAQNPAMTNVVGWAAELVQESYGEFMDLLVGQAVVPQIPMQRYQFDSYGRIIIPTREPNPGNQNLAGYFRAEGAPIRIGAAKTGSKTLTPKSMAVITTMTKEMLRHSTPNLETMAREWMIEDTAEVLDGIFLDAVPADVIRPAGIQNGIAVGDTAASTGNTAANIQADIRGRVTAMANHKMGRRPVWLMNPARAMGVAMAITAAGEKAFPEASGTAPRLAGIPILTSVNVPADIVFLVDAAFLGFSGGAPEFEVSDTATVHEDSGLPAVDGKTADTVKPIVDGAGAPAAPSRSFFQTHSLGIKAYWEIDWAVLRTGAVQTITGVAW